ncbi:MAG: peptidoglycan-associated lipoprotein Pal [Alphaproteobacteria bacterium]|nr:peptidoglycan-associated lipoprotein Pal [Alphaproteobacteria bacterium]
MRIPLASTLLLGVGLLVTPACKKKGEVTESPLDQPSDLVEPEPAAKNVPDHVKSMVENFNKVFFDFDSSELTDPSKGALDENVRILQEHPDVKVQIQGHADERGTTEYNLALGQRRANSLKEYLIGQGIAPSRLTLLSYGEERPLDSRSNETAWSKNRRAEFVITWGGSDDVKSSTE